MTRSRLIACTTLAMFAFAGNSLLCRTALKQTSTDPSTFTVVRLLSGAMMLWLVTRKARGSRSLEGSWLSASVLFLYAATFSFAYVRLPASTGSLLLFGAVQITMLGYGLFRGERLARVQMAGLGLALAGLVGLLWPGLSSPSLPASLLMLTAGISWGAYSLSGRGGGEPVLVTAGNFFRSVPLAFALGLGMGLVGTLSLDRAGLCYAVMSGALASALGYVIWYTALPELKATSAGVVQLSVPVIAAFGGVVLLGEPFTFRFVLTSVAILGGIGLVLWHRHRSLAG